MKSVEKDMIDINYEECREGKEQVCLFKHTLYSKGEAANRKEICFEEYNIWWRSIFV